jgi:hypothetical protein
LPCPALWPGSLWPELPTGLAGTCDFEWLFGLFGWVLPSGCCVDDVSPVSEPLALDAGVVVASAVVGHEPFVSPWRSCAGQAFTLMLISWKGCFGECV